jgi:hypothetical protein
MANKTEIGSLRCVLRYIPSEKNAKKVFQKYTPKGWEDIDLKSLEQQAQWETSEQMSLFFKVVNK